MKTNYLTSGLKNIFVKLEIVDVFFILLLLLRLSSAAAGGRGKGREGEKEEEYNARVMGGVANCEVKNFLLSPPLFVGRSNVVRRKEGGFFLFLPPFSSPFRRNSLVRLINVVSTAEEREEGRLKEERKRRRKWSRRLLTPFFP